MHGMICKSIEAFLTTAHGPNVWQKVRKDAGVDYDHFEAMLTYPDDDFRAVQCAAAAHLGYEPVHLMEDIGTWICTHPPLEPVRRLFRFTGTTFEDLLISLDEIDARGRMALPDLELPSYHVNQNRDDEFEVRSTWIVPGASGLLTGLLRVLADEYGTLAIIDIQTSRQVPSGWMETVSIQLVEASFHAPKAFSLGGEA